MIGWTRRSVPVKANRWIKRRIDLFNDNVKQKLVKNRLKHFLEVYLEPDGIFMIRMISNNTSDYVATDLIHHLWCLHDDKYGHLFMNNEIHEPHNSKMQCLYEHKKKINNDDNIQTEIPSINRGITSNTNSNTESNFITFENYKISPGQAIRNLTK